MAEILKYPEELKTLPHLLKSDVDTVRNTITLLSLLCSSEDFRNTLIGDRDVLEAITFTLKSSDVKTGSAAAFAVAALLFEPGYNAEIHHQIYFGLLSSLQDSMCEVSSPTETSPSFHSFRHSLKAVFHINKKSEGRQGFPLDCTSSIE